MNPEIASHAQRAVEHAKNAQKWAAVSLSCACIAVALSVGNLLWLALRWR